MHMLFANTTPFYLWDKHLRILVSAEGPGTNSLWTLREDYTSTGDKWSM